MRAVQWSRCGADGRSDSWRFIEATDMKIMPKLMGPNARAAASWVMTKMSLTMSQIKSTAPNNWVVMLSVAYARGFCWAWWVENLRFIFAAARSER